jgi:transposase
MSSSLGLSVIDRQKIREWISAYGTPQQVALRCRIVLGAAEGEADSAIARRLSVNRNTVILWRKRFVEFGLDGLWDIAPGRGRKPTYELDKIRAIVNATLQTKPAGMTHWSCRTLAEQQGVSKSTVNNIWRAHHLQPHRTETFKLSRDPKFLEKMTDVVGLYLNPPQQAIVLCVDEKSQIQALDRTQPGLPIKKGRCGTMTHDYKRNDDPIRGAGDSAGKGSRRMPSATPASRVPEIFTPARSRVSRHRSAPSGHGQLRYSQASESERVAETSSAVCASFRAHQLQLDESCRAVVRSPR